MNVPTTLALLASILMLLIGLLATSSPSSFVGAWLKRGADCGDGTPGHFLTVGGTGAGALSVAVTSLLALLAHGDLPIVLVPSPLADYLSTARCIAIGSLATISVYAKMWYGGGMARRLGASRSATDVAFATCLAVAGQSLLRGAESEETALQMVRALNNVLVPWTLAHYLYPRLLRWTFSVDVTEAEAILVRAATSFFLANHVLQASLARGAVPVRAVSYVAVVMLLSSLDFQLRCNPKWGVGGVPKGVEIDWSRVNGVRTRSIVSLGISYFL